eukprot:gene6473-3110_t
MTIVYKPGPENQADALSRLFLSEIVDLLPHQVIISDPIQHDISLSYSEDPLYSQAEHPKRPSFLQKHNDLWYFQGRLCVPNVPDLRLRILQEYHDAPSAGHPGFHKTLNAVADKFWWPRMTRTVRSYVASCPTCQRTKPSSMSSPGLLRPHDVPSRPWSHVSVDLITDLPRSVCYDGATYDAIATFVYMLTKQAIFVRITKNITASQLANVYLDHVYAKHGLSTFLVSDRDPRFDSELFAALGTLFAALGTTPCLLLLVQPSTCQQHIIPKQMVRPSALIGL